MHSIGVDIIEICRIEKAVERWGLRFLRRTYTETELHLSRQKPFFPVFRRKMKYIGTTCFMDVRNREKVVYTDYL